MIRLPEDYTVKPLLQERGRSHGDAQVQFTFAQVLKQYIHGSKSWHEMTDMEHYVLDMLCAKISRICCGDPHFEDHWRDVAGYATLVADALKK